MKSLVARSATLETADMHGRVTRCTAATCERRDVSNYRQCVSESSKKSLLYGFHRPRPCWNERTKSIRPTANSFRLRVSTNRDRCDDEGV